LSEHSLAPYGNRVVRPPADPRRDAARRTLSWVLVGLVHGMLLGVLTFSFIQDRQIIGQRSPIEIFFDLSALRNSDAPEVSLIKPDVEAVRPPDVNSAPVMIMPPKELTPEERVAPAKPGDVLRAIGEALACGASNFENLTDQQRARCRHTPWIPRKLPNGTIVMEAPPKLVAQPEFRLSGADKMRQDMRSGPPCPILQQTPCVNDILTGRNNKPF